MLGAVIFDFDGVIVDSEKLHHRAFNEVASQFNIEITTEDYYGRHLGLTDREVFEILVADNSLNDYTARIDQLVAEKTAIFKHLAEAEAVVIDGVSDFLDMLRENNVPVAICSGALAPEIELILAGANLADYFRVIVAAEHVQRGKPDPQGFLLALQKLNDKLSRDIRPSDCVVVEDSRWGLQAAKAAGMHAVAVTNTYEPAQLAAADRIVEKLSDLRMEDLHRICG